MYVNGGTFPYPTYVDDVPLASWVDQWRCTSDVSCNVCKTGWTSYDWGTCSYLTSVITYCAQFFPSSHFEEGW